MDTLIVFAASYDTLGAAEADYSAVRDFYLESGLIDTYDAAVLTRDAASDLGDRIGRVLNRADKVTRKQLEADQKALEKEIDAAMQAQAG